MKRPRSEVDRRPAIGEHRVAHVGMSPLQVERDVQPLAADPIADAPLKVLQAVLQILSDVGLDEHEDRRVVRVGVGPRRHLDKAGADEVAAGPLVAEIVGVDLDRGGG
ncbi:MAG: hypothetical protein R3F65_08460 [bacterium]